MENSEVKDVVNFDFNGVDIRVVAEIDGKPMFVAKDVAECLGFKDTQKANRHCKKRVVVKKSEVPPEMAETLFGSRAPTVTLIPESDVYHLVMRSQLPAAEDFQDWVCEEVLPSVRKHGGYIQGQEKLEGKERDAVTGFVEDIAQAILSNVERAVEKSEDKQARALKVLSEGQRERVSDIAIEASCRKMGLAELTDSIKASFRNQFGGKK